MLIPPLVRKRQAAVFAPEARFISENRRVMNQKEKRKMTTITIIKMNETEAKRFWEGQERLLTIPLSKEADLACNREIPYGSMTDPDFL